MEVGSFHNGSSLERQQQDGFTRYLFDEVVALLILSST